MQIDLAYFFPLGGGLSDLAKSGQDRRFVGGEFPYYLRAFGKMYLFDYSDKTYLTGNEKLIQLTNNHRLHRFIYSFVFPFLHFKTIKNCSVIRVSHLLGMIPAIISAIFLRKKVVFNYGYEYSGFALMEKKYLHAFLFKILEFFSFKCASGVICTNTAIYKKLKNKVHNPIFIPNRVDIDLFKPEMKSNQKNKEFHIISVGRLEKQKNYLSLIKAIGRLKNESLKLTIIGRGSKKQELYEEAKKNGVNIEIIENVPNDRLPFWYNQADLFVLPSLKEGSPKVLLEAMSSGCVCLVSSIRENAELIEDGIDGFLCELDDESIAEKIIEIQSRSDLETIKKNVRQKIEKNYSFKLLMKKEVDYLYEISH